MTEIEKAIADLKQVKINVAISKILNPEAYQYPVDKKYLYFIVGADLVKIGSARDVEVRMEALQTGFPSKLTILFKKENMDHREFEIHKKFNHLRCYGEWFHLTDEIHHFVNELKNDSFPIDV